MASGDQAAQYTGVTVYSDDQALAGYNQGAPSSITRTQVLTGQGANLQQRTVQKIMLVSAADTLADSFGLDPAKTYTITITES